MGEKTLRAVRKPEVERANISQTCEAFSCTRRTNDKPLCSKHIEGMPYVQGILGLMARRDEDIENLGKMPLPHDSLLIDEVIQLCRELGGLSVSMAAKRCYMTKTQMLKLVGSLRKRKLIRITKNKRKEIVIYAYK